MRNLCSQSIKTREILSLPAPRATINHKITVHGMLALLRLTSHNISCISEHPWANTSWHTAQIDSSSLAKPLPQKCLSAKKSQQELRCSVYSIWLFRFVFAWLPETGWQSTGKHHFPPSIYIYITLYHPTFSGILRLCLSSVNVQASPFILLTAASSHTCYLASAFTAPCCQRCNASNFTSQTAFLITLL